MTEKWRQTWRIRRCQKRNSLVRRVYRATTKVPRERSRVSGGNSSNVEEELSRNFQIPCVGAQQPPLYNPRVNYGINGSGGEPTETSSLPFLLYFCCYSTSLLHPSPFRSVPPPSLPSLKHKVVFHNLCSCCFVPFNKIILTQSFFPGT